MGIAAGGAIKQAIVRDPGKLWCKSETKTFNIQILNSIHFRHVTGKNPPETPIDARTYVRLGYPFYSIYEEPNDIAGDFLDVQSIGQIDGVLEPQVHPKVVRLSRKKGNDASEDFKEGSTGSAGETADHEISNEYSSSRRNRCASAPLPSPSTKSQTKKVRSLHPQVGFWNTQNVVAEFRDVDALEREIRQHGATLF